MCHEIHELNTLNELVTILSNQEYKKKIIREYKLSGYELYNHILFSSVN